MNMLSFLIISLLVALAHVAYAQPTTVTYYVNSTADFSDTNLSDNQCADENGN